MEMKYLRALLLVFVGALVLDPPDLDSCGPFIPQAQFAWIHGPVGDGKAFARGELGVLRPHFYRRGLIPPNWRLRGGRPDAAANNALFAARPQRCRGAGGTRPPRWGR